MAGYTIKTTVQFDNTEAVKKTEQARAAIRKQKEEVARLTSEVERLNREQADPKVIVAAQKRAKEAKQTLNIMKESFKEVYTEVLDLQRAINNLNGVNLNTITRAIAQAQKQLKNLGGKTDEESIKKINELYNNILPKLRARQAELQKGFQDAFREATSGSKLTYDQMIRLREALTAGLEAVRNNAREYKRYKQTIADLNVSIHEFDIGQKQVFQNLKAASEPALEAVKRHLEAVVASGEASKQKLKEATDQLKQIQEEQTRRADVSTRKVLGTDKSVKRASIDEIREARASAMQLRESVKAGGDAFNEYTAMILRADAVLEQYDIRADRTAQKEKMHHEEMVQSLKNVSNASDTSLALQKKYWQEMVAGAEKGSTELTTYEANLRKVTEEEQARAASAAKNTIAAADRTSSSFNENIGIAQVKEAVQMLERMRDETAEGTAKWNEYNDAIKAGKAYLDQYARNQAVSRMTEQMKDLTNVSDKALAEQKKFWQESVAGADKNNSKLQEYKDNLAKVVAEEQRRREVTAKDVMTNVQSGNWNKTIAETKEAIEVLKQYKEQLKVTDKSGIEEVNNAMTLLDQKVKAVKEGMMGLSEAQQMGREAVASTFTGTIEQAGRAKQALEEYKKTLRADDAKGIKAVEQQIAALDQATKGVTMTQKRYDEILRSPRAATYNELKDAIARAEEELKNMTRNQKEFNDQAARLKGMKARLQELQKEWSNHSSTLSQAFSRLKSYILVYMGFNALLQRTRQVVSNNMELADSLAAVQRVSGLAREEVLHLSASLDRLQTRTTQKELMDLAYQASKLGIAERGGATALRQFTESGNMLISALGEDLGGAKAVSNLLKIADLMGETARQGGHIDKALIATGSAILDIGNKSAASYGYVADFASRLGGIAASANMTMPDLLALGGTMDALGQRIEMSTTSLNKFIVNMAVAPEKVAKASGVAADEIKRLMAEGDALGAMIKVFEGLNEKGGGLGYLGSIMKDLGGSHSARATQAISALVNNVEKLKELRGISQYGFEQARSVEREYELMNNNAMGYLKRFSNSIREIFTNSGMNESLTQFTFWLSRLPRLFKENWTIIKAVGAALATTFSIRKLREFGVELNTKLGPKIQAVFHPGSVRGFGTALKELFGPMGLINMGVMALGLLIGKLRKAYEEAHAVEKMVSKGYADATRDAANAMYLLSDINKQYDEHIAATSSLDKERKKVSSGAAAYLSSLKGEATEWKNLALARELTYLAIERGGSNAQQDIQLANEWGRTMANNAKDTEAYRKARENLNKTWGTDISLMEAGITAMTDMEAVQRALSVATEEQQKQYGFNAQEETARAERMAVLKARADETANAEGRLAVELSDQLKVLAEEVVSLDRSDFARKMLIKRMKEQGEYTDVEAQKLDELFTSLDGAARGTEKYREAKEKIQKNYQSYLDNIATEIKAGLTLKETYDMLAESIMDAALARGKAKVLEEAQDAYNEVDSEQRQKIYNRLVNWQVSYNNQTQEVNVPTGWNKPGGGQWQMGDKLFTAQTAGIIARELTEYFKSQGTNNPQTKPLSQGAQFVLMNDARGGSGSLWDFFNPGKFGIQEAGAELTKAASKLTESVEMAENVFGPDRKKDKTPVVEDVKFTAVDPNDDKDKKGGKDTHMERIRAALAALDEYYAQREAKIKHAREMEQITEAEANRQTENNEAEHLARRADLRYMFLQDTKAYGENFKHIADADAQHIYTITRVSQKQMKELATWLTDKGKAEVDGIAKNAAQDLVKLEEIYVKHNKRIKKALEESQSHVAKVTETFTDSLDKLDLIFNLGGDADLDPAVLRRRIEVLIKLAENAHTLTAEQLQGMMAEETAFSDWQVGRTQEDYEVLLQLLQQFLDDRTEAIRKDAKRRKKLIDFKWDNSEVGKSWAYAEESTSQVAETAKKSNQYGLSDDQTVRKAEVLALETQIRAKQTYIDMARAEMAVRLQELEIAKNQAAQGEEATRAMIEGMKMRGEATEEQEAMLQEIHDARMEREREYNEYKTTMDAAMLETEQEMLELRNEQREKEDEIMSARMEKLQNYIDALGEFGEQMGEAAWGEVEDRKAAAKQLLKTTMQLTKDIIMDELKRLLMKKTIAQAENALTQSTADTNTAIQAGAAVKDLTITEAKTVGDVTSGIASGGGKTVGQLGWWGIPLLAVIGAALSALMGVAMGAINKAKEQVQSVAPSAGRMATGMLTYASGNTAEVGQTYDVDGADGRAYKARYEGAGMKTGIYRGGAHFGIFSEKQPEMILSGPTTQRLILNHKDVLAALMDIDRGRAPRQRMQTFAEGNMDDIAGSAIPEVAAEGANASLTTLLEQNTAVMDALLTAVQDGINFNFDQFHDSQVKYDRWRSRNKKS